MQKILFQLNLKLLRLKINRNMKWIIFLIAIFSYSNACDSFGSADYFSMMDKLAVGQQDSAKIILESQHCNDSVAWVLSNDLMKKEKKVEDSFQWIVQEKCIDHWVYADIPIYYVKFNIREKKKGLILSHIFYETLENSNCPDDIKELIMIDLDGLYAFFYEMSD